MKTKNLFIAILALTGATLGASSARADFYATGDLLLGFRSTDTAQDYIINLGPVGNFAGFGDGYSEDLSLGNIGADLSSVFGASWASDPDLYWGVAGAASPLSPSPATDTLYVGNAEAVFGVPGAPLDEAPRSATYTTGGLINNVGEIADSVDTTSTNASDAVIQSGSESATWDSYMPGGSNDANTGLAFKTYQATFEGNSAAGITGDPLDLYQLTAMNGAGPFPGTYEGTFTINGSGDVNFAVIPEPSTVGTIVLGAALLGFFGYRRSRAARA